ncbi:addiction module antitoxin RelB [Clostridia bacterium]|nr:addiction module antitoxin RelB [Clostridia bacterium]
MNKSNSTTMMSLRIDSTLKKQSEELFSDLGMNMSTAVNLFLRQAVQMQGIPFSLLKRPNTQTLRAIEETEQMLKNPNTPKFSTVEDLVKDLEADDV